MGRERQGLRVTRTVGQGSNLLGLTVQVFSGYLVIGTRGCTRRGNEQGRSDFQVIGSGLGFVGVEVHQ